MALGAAHALRVTEVLPITSLHGDGCGNRSAAGKQREGGNRRKKNAHW